MSALCIEVAYADRQLGDLGLLAGVGLISDAIREAERLGGELTDPNFAPSHAFICAQNYTLEAIFPRISLSPWNIYDGQSTRIFRVLVPDALKMAALMQTEHEWLNASYGLGGVVLGMGVAELEEAFGFAPDRNLFANGQTQWCSQLANNFLRILIPDDMQSNLVSPARLLGYLEALAA